MMLSDVLWLVLIVSGTGFLLYRSFWNSKGHCAGCSQSSSCKTIQTK